jgi:hypothetical protein
MAAMQLWVDQQLERLQSIHGDYWEIWTVSKSPAALGYTWCARPKGTPIATLHADHPDDLDALIKAEQEKEGNRNGTAQHDKG